MPARAPQPMGSTSHSVPRRLGPLSDTASVPAAQAVPLHGADGGDESEVMLYTLDGGGYEDQRPQDELGEDDHEEEEEEGEGEEGDGNDDEDDEDDEDNEESPHYAGHHNCPFHGQQPFTYALDANLAGNADMSDDSGAPLVEDALSHLFADDVDMNGSTGLSNDDGSSSTQGGASDHDSLFTHDLPDPPIAQIPADLDNISIADHPPMADAPDAAAYAQMAFFGTMHSPLFTTPFAQTLAPGAIWAQTFSFSNPNPSTIGPSNYSLSDFLENWARQSRILQGMPRGSCPWPYKVRSLQLSADKSIRYDDLEGDQCDFQGVDWEEIGVTRQDARERRLLTYSNYVNIPGSDRWTPNLPDVALPRRESFFRFRRMDLKRNIHLSHFQLRHVFASTSRSRVFYPAIGAVQQFNPMSGHGRAVLKLTDAPASQISTLAAGHGVLVAGGFGGEYIFRHLDSGEPENTACHEGVITNSVSGITNHVAVHQARTSSAPIAAFASNDNRFRVLDLTTERWLSQETHDFAPNCTALSPDGRLRVMVGDSLDVVIAAAESRLPGGEPEILQRLSGHRDYGFACDWADDGWTIATAFQDKTVKIWDARRLTDREGNAVSVCTIRSEIAGVRSLRFSPVGSGKRVLVAAEEADFVNIIDARTFRSKQTVDVFGELGGISFENGGQDLMVLCCDRTRGGVLQLERCGGEGEFMLNEVEEYSRGHRHQRRGGATSDWPRSMFTEARRVSESSSRRRRRAAAHVEMEPF